jgi:hypothetical protein
MGRLIRFLVGLHFLLYSSVPSLLSFPSFFAPFVPSFLRFFLFLSLVQPADTTFVLVVCSYTATGTLSFVPPGLQGSDHVFWTTVLRF